MICKFCGMDSATTDVCSWCGKSLTGTQTAPAAVPAAPLTASGLTEAAADVGAMTPALAAPADTAAPTAPPANPKIAPAMPAPSRMRAPAPAMPPPSTRAATAPPLVLSDANAVSSAVPSLAGADLNAPAQPLARDLNAPASLTSSPVAPTPALPDAAPLIGSVPAPALSSAPLAAPFDLSTGGASASLTGTAPPGTADRASRPVAARPPVDMSGDVAIGTVTARPGAIPDTPTSEPQLTKTDAERKAIVDAALADDGPTPMALLTRYLGVFAGILLATGILSFILKRFYIAPMLIAMFVSALLLPIMRVTPWADEGSDDLVWFALLTLLFGPVVALIIYGVMALARQDFNPSILGCLTVAALVRVVAELASGGVALGHLIQATSPFSSLGHIDARLVEMLLLNWAGFVALAGWYAASSFHKEDE